MRKVIVSEFLSLDGVMQAPGGPEEDTEGGFAHGGWQMPYSDEVLGTAVLEGMAAADAFLLGRKTYEIFAAYWPSSDDEEFADTMNGMAKFVASETLDDVEWQNSTLIEGDVAEGVARLKQQPGKNIQVIGSGDLARTLMQHDLVDEYQLMIHPVVLGSGKRLFGKASDTTALRLVETRTTTTGVVILTYQPEEKA